MSEIATEADMYRCHGFGYAEAHRILAAGCQYPPSLEGFAYLLTAERERSGLEVAPESMARRIVASTRFPRNA